MKTIYIDGILTFGKYKGRAVSDIVERDPGYFLWLMLMGKHKLDKQVDTAVAEWAGDHPEDVEKVMRSVTKAKEKSKEEASDDDDDEPRKSHHVEASVTTDVSFSTHAKSAEWGSW